MEIITESIEDMIKITAGLVRESVNFTAKQSADKTQWIITFTGGY